MKLKIGKSKFHGKGVVALQNIKKGERIFDIEGKIVHYLISNHKKAQKIDFNIIGLDKNTWIKPKSFGFFYNHSCAPNSVIMKRTGIFALRNIKKGEEITSDYSLSEGDIFWKIGCTCGSKNCRKVIRSIQFLPLNIFKKYEKYVAPYFQKVFVNFHASKFKNMKELQDEWVGFIKKDYRV